MKIIFKFLFKNVYENKLRTLLILISITLSTALLLSTISISGTMKKMLIDQIIKYTGTSEIVIQKDPQKTNDPFFEMIDVELNGKVDYTVGIINGRGTFESAKGEVPVFIGGYNINDLKKVHNPVYEQIDTTAFNDYNVIIGKNDALVNNLKINDQITLRINGDNYQFTIYAIASPKGLFEFDSHSLSVIVPINTLASIYENENKVNSIFVKTINAIDTQSVIETLSEAYPGYIVKTTVTQRQIDANISQFTSMFSIMLILVIFISLFIIYTSFKVITLEKLPVIGTLRSIGATKKSTNLILLCEGLIYGFIGGILGLILGLVILNIMMNMLAFNAFTGLRFKVEMVIKFEHIIISFLFSLLLSVISSIMPIIKVSKIAVRDIIFNNHKEVSKNGKVRSIIAVALIFVSISLLLIFTKGNLIIGAIALIIATISIIMLVPLLTHGFILLFAKIASIFGNEGVLAVKNIRRSKTIINNIALLSIGIASILMINTASQSVGNEVLNVFNKANYEIVFSHPHLTSDIQEQINEIDGVESSYGLYLSSNVKIKEKNDYVQQIYGINANEYFKYWDFQILGNKEEIIDEFHQGRNIIISKVNSEKFELNPGDKITLMINSEEIQYTIIGVVNSLMSNGNFIMIPENYFIEDTQIEFMIELFIKTNKEVSVVAKNIEEAFEEEYFNILLMSDIYKQNMDSNNQVFLLLGGFSLITMIIGIFGIFNNFVINFISRKRSLAIFRSIGMSKNQTLKMLVLESIFGGIIGGIIGIISAFYFVEIASYIAKSMFMPIQMNITGNLFMVGFISGILVSVVAAILPALKSSKQNIVEGIKYE